MSRENPVFRGRMEACFHHFRRQFDRRHPKGSKGAEKAREPLADFCGVRAHSVSRWFYSDTTPGGTEYLKLTCFLQVQGYIISELQGLGVTELGLLELIGFSITTPDQVQKHIGWPQAGQMFKVLRGEGKLVNGRAEKGWALLKEHRAAMKAKKEALTLKPPYKYGAVIGAPLMHRALLGSMEALTFLLQADIPAHEIDNLRTRLGDAPTDLSDQLDAFMTRLQPEEE